MSHSRSPDVSKMEEIIESLRNECRRKDHFIATLAHELRNPITALRAAVHLQELSGDDFAMRQKTFDIIARQTDHMERLIDDLMDVSRLSRGKVSLDKHILDLTTVVGQAVVDQQKSFEDRDVELRLRISKGPLWVEGDFTRLTQVIGNLLNNARKATEPGDYVTVQLSHDKAAGQAVLEIIDTGVGMETDELEKIFERFAQTNGGKTRGGGGLGLGLAIVNGLVKLHGGRVRAHSAGLDEGSTFEVRLPISPPPEDEAHRDPTRESISERRILVVEDDRDVAQLLVQLLKLEGHHVEVAYDAEEGLEKLKLEAPDAILCDLQLPGALDGFALCQAVRVDPRFESVRLVAMTGHGGEEIRERSLGSGFDEHLTKPVDLDELRRALHR